MLLTGVTPPRRSRVRAAAAVAAANSGPNLVLMGSHSGEESKRCTGLALKLGRRLLFSHIWPINGLCCMGRVGHTSIAIEALMLGGPRMNVNVNVT